MKFNMIVLVVLFSALLILSGCKLQEPDIKSAADVELTSVTTTLFGSYVSLGNSLTAGYQSGALTANRQKHSFVKLIAKQAGVGDAFVQPLLGYPGLGAYASIGAGIMELTGFDSTGNPVLTPMPYTVTGFDPTNPYASTEIMTYAAPYSNLGIPGIVLADLDSAITSANSYSQSGLIDVVLRNANPAFGNTNPIEQALLLQPTLVSIWIGNNDVLGYATNGGTYPTAPTDAATFQYLYNNMLAKVTSTGAKAVVANVPDVTSVPYFTTVGASVSPTALYIETAGGVRLGTANDLLLLSGKSAIGDATGTYGPVGVPVGFAESAPLPSAFVLDSDEITVAQNAVDAYNTAIETVAAQHGVPVVDVNSYMRDLADGMSVAGIEVSAAYLTGGVFSLDGVHPNSFGNALIANQFIETINAYFETNVPPVNLGDYIKNDDPDDPVVFLKTSNQSENFYQQIPKMFGGKAQF